MEREKELAVIVARNTRGEEKVYPVVEMVFNEEGNILDTLVAPARIDKRVESKAKEIAIEAVRALNGIGVFAVEMFLAKDGRILVNELAPRVHNSGHFTIEACVTNQFEQHIRAILGLPLGDTRLLSPAAMVNLLGAPDSRGEPCIEGLDYLFSIRGAHLHWYEKREIRPFRKMGHVTILGESVEDAIRKAMLIRSKIKVVAKPQQHAYQ